LGEAIEVGVMVVIVVQDPDIRWSGQRMGGAG
jgi:hypothetical protein